MKKTIAVLILVVCVIIIFVVSSFSTVTNEKNYCANGSPFNISLPINIHYISREISNINDSLVKEINCNSLLDSQTGYGTISFNGCDMLTLIAVFELYDKEKRCFFKDYEILILTRSQIDSLCNNKNRVKLQFQRDIQCALYLNGTLTNSSNTTIVDVSDNNKIIPVNIFLKKDRNTIGIYSRTLVGIIGTSSSVMNDQKFSVISKPEIIYWAEDHLGDYTVFDR
jgi:hypothetical protein